MAMRVPLSGVIMSGTGGDSGNKKKLLILATAIAAIVVIFAGIILIANWLGTPLGVDLSALGLGHKDDGTYTANTIFNNISYSNGAVQISMLKAVENVLQTSQGSDWSREHPNWYVYNCRANNVDGMGLSRTWVVSLKTDASMLVATLSDNTVTNVTIQGTDEIAVNDTVEYPDGSVDQNPADSGVKASTPVTKLTDLLDTGKIMRITLDETHVSSPAVTAPFIIDYLDNGESARYTISFKDGVTPTRSFVVEVDAHTGHILRSDRGVSQ